jgi:hypothetical protein
LMATSRPNGRLVVVKAPLAAAIKRPARRDRARKPVRAARSQPRWRLGPRQAAGPSGWKGRRKPGGAGVCGQVLSRREGSARQCVALRSMRPACAKCTWSAAGTPPPAPVVAARVRGCTSSAPSTRRSAHRFRRAGGRLSVASAVKATGPARWLGPKWPPAVGTSTSLAV